MTRKLSLRPLQSPSDIIMRTAAAIESRPGRRPNRPCVVARGREPAPWEAHPHHQYPHTNSCLPRCDNGRRWKSRVVPPGEGDPIGRPGNPCEIPVRMREDLTILKRIDMISAGDIIGAVDRYLEWDRYQIAEETLT